METLNTPSEYSVNFNHGFQGVSMANIETGGSALFAKSNFKYISVQIITCHPSIYTMDHPDFIVYCFIENSIVHKSLTTGKSHTITN